MFRAQKFRCCLWCYKIKITSTKWTRQNETILYCLLTIKYIFISYDENIRLWKYGVLITLDLDIVTVFSSKELKPLIFNVCQTFEAHFVLLTLAAYTFNRKMHSSTEADVIIHQEYFWFKITMGQALFICIQKSRFWNFHGQSGQFDDPRP